MSDCLFCRIAEKQVPAEILLENDDLLAFKDVNPQAPTHVLVIPRKHVATVNDLEDDDETLVGKLYTAARRLAGEAGIADSGYRLVMNTNENGGQSVYHIHLHVLGGRKMKWPPG